MKKIFIYCSLAFCFISIGMFCVTDFVKQSVVINEVSGSPVRDAEHGVTMDSDYVELYNPTKFSVSLEGMYLSDDIEALQKYHLKDYRIPAGGYLVIELEEGEAPFKVKASGEHLYLSCDSKVVDEVECGETDYSVVYARKTDGGEGWGYQYPTPGKANTREAPGVKTASPKFSAASGYYSEEFPLELYAENGCKIYYTIDGSKPDENSALYTKAIAVENVSDKENRWNQIRNVVEDWENYQPDTAPVDKLFLVRAVAVDASGNVSEEAVGTYLVDMEGYREKKVVSLVADEEDLFGENGIYVTGKEYDTWYQSGQRGDSPTTNFRKHGRDYEIPASFSLLEDEDVFSQNVGIRIQGASARQPAKKRFSVYARKEYSGSSYFDRELFPGKRTHSIVLRNGFADAFVSKLVSDREVAVKDAEPVTVFLNGEYWYDTFMQEKYSDSFVNQTYGVEKDNVIIVHDGEIEEGNEDDHHFYGDIYAYYSTHDFTTQEGYEGFDDVLDIQSYIDYLCINIYMCNMDVSERKNSMMWRVRQPGEGKYEDGAWRMMLYDMDALEWRESLCKKYNVDCMAQINSFSEKMKSVGGSTYNSQGIYITLKQNPQYCRQFVTTFMDLVNTDFRVERTAELLESWGEDITWNDSFFAERAGYICRYLAEEFGLEGSLENVTLECDSQKGGSIQLNTVEAELENGSWSGQYFTDYPIKISAKPRKGYRFAGWSGSVESREETLEVPVEKGGIRLRAEFAKEST